MNLNNIPDAFAVTLRIKLLSCLVSSSLSFNEIKAITQATNGNISVQLSKLEEWGYLSSHKTIANKKTLTLYTLTSFGLAQFEEYVLLLQTILAQAKK